MQTRRDLACRTGDHALAEDEAASQPLDAMQAFSQGSTDTSGTAG